MELPPPEQMGRFMEDAAIAMLICDADRVHYANRSFARLLGYTDPDELAARDPIDDFVSPEHRDACRESLLRVLHDETATEQQWFHARRGDGADIYLHARFHPMASPGGARAFLTIVDDTEEREERNRLAMLRRAVAAVSEAVFVTDMPGKILYANQAAGDLLGVAADQLLGTSALALISPYAPLDQENYFRTRENPVRSGELLLRRPSGEDFPAAITVSLFRGMEGAEPFAMAIVRDLTVQKEMEAERARREEQLAIMLREAHHRIKNSLQIACDVLDLQRRAATSGEVAQALDHAANRVRALSAVHEWISPDHDVAVVGARQLVQTIADNLRDTLADPRRTVRFDVQVEDHRIGSREATAFALIVTELVTNALRHASPGTVGVRFAAQGGSTILEVTDDGQGAGPDLAAGEGRGFGLELVSLLAEEQLRGTFEMKRDGGRTVARVTCPACLPPTDETV